MSPRGQACLHRQISSCERSDQCTLTTVCCLIIAVRQQVGTIRNFLSSPSMQRHIA